MKSTQFKKMLGILGLTQEGAASLFKLSVRSINAYANGASVPRSIELVLKIINKYGHNLKEIDKL